MMAAAPAQAAAASQAAAGASAADVQGEAGWPAGRPVIFVSGQTEQGMAMDDLVAAEPRFMGCSDRQLLINMAAIQHRVLEKVRQMEKRVHFMEARQDAAAALPAEAAQRGRDRERDRQSGP